MQTQEALPRIEPGKVEESKKAEGKEMRNNRKCPVCGKSMRLINVHINDYLAPYWYCKCFEMTEEEREEIKRRGYL